MKRIRIHIEQLTAEGWTYAASLPLGPEQTDILSDWLSDTACDITAPLDGVTGAKLWELPDDLLEWLLTSCEEALEILRQDFPEIEADLILRFGVEFVAKLVPGYAELMGLPGEDLEQMEAPTETKH